jgi:hypothetical protein
MPPIVRQSLTRAQINPNVTYGQIFLLGSILFAPLAR